MRSKLNITSLNSRLRDSGKQRYLLLLIILHHTTLKLQVHCIYNTVGLKWAPYGSQHSKSSTSALNWILPFSIFCVPSFICLASTCIVRDPTVTVSSSFFTYQKQISFPPDQCNVHRWKQVIANDGNNSKLKQHAVFFLEVMMKCWGRADSHLQSWCYIDVHVHLLTKQATLECPPQRSAVPFSISPRDLLESAAKQIPSLAHPISSAVGLFHGAAAQPTVPKHWAGTQLCVCRHWQCKGNEAASWYRFNLTPAGAPDSVQGCWEMLPLHACFLKPVCLFWENPYTWTHYSHLKMCCSFV